MAGATIKGYAAMQPGEKLVPFSYEAPALRDDEVRISVTHCGLCGSDIQAIDDVYSVFKFPFMPGHEVVGMISEVGKQVNQDQIGKRVGVGWQGRSCGHCEWCLKGEVNLCMDVVHNGTWTPYGGFSTSIVVQEGFAYPLPEEVPSDVAAVMMCAGFTVYTALSRNFNPIYKKLGIVGIGGLGHLAIQFAKAMGYEVTAISSSERKREEVISLGADRFVPLTDRAALKQMAYYYDQLYITSHGGIEWDRLLEILTKKGKIILSGFPQINCSPVDLVVHELSITGSFVGTRAEMRDMLQYASTHKIHPMIELVPLSQINQAIEKCRQNQAHYRMVLVNDFR